MRDFAGKTAFVTGGAAGIGLALGRAFAQNGMKVMLADIESETLQAAVKSLQAIGPDVSGTVCDVTDPASVERAAIRSFLPHMRQHGEGGHIVNTASMAGMNGGLGFSPYAASKFAVVAMSEGLAVQLKPHRIGVSVLCPSFVRTGIGESGRNRPERYGPARAPDPASPAAAMVAEIKRMIDAGLAPDYVAARVLDAIRADEFYVFTHPGMRAEVEGRFAAILAAMDKVPAP